MIRKKRKNYNRGMYELEFEEVLKKAREDKGLTQTDVANVFGLSRGTYAAIEQGRSGYRSKSVIEILTHDFYTKKEQSNLKKAYAIMKKEQMKVEYKGQKAKKTTTQRIKEITEKKKSSKQRIPNIPNFYRDLDALGKLSEIDLDDPRLKALHKKLGVEKAFVRQKGRNQSFPNREWLGDALKEFRKENRHNMKEAAEIIGVVPHSYRLIEYGQRSTQSEVLRKVVQSDYYTEKEQSKLLRIYYKMQEEEQKVNA